MFEVEVERLHEFCARWRMSRAKAYRLMRAGVLPYHLVGAQRCITRSDRDAFARRCARGK
jgi:excisionase family DNA binding protein